MSDLPSALTASSQGQKQLSAYASSLSERDEKLWDAAQQLEASFVAEMLKSAGFGEARESFGGGIGEEQFTSFLRQTQAEKMVHAGGFGLAESIFEALKERTLDAD